MTTPTPAAPTSDPASTQAPAAPQTPAPATPAAPAIPAAPATPAAPAAAPAAEPQDVASLPVWAQQEIREARADAARYRQQARDAQQAAPPAPVAPVDVPDGDISRLPRWAQTQVTTGQDAARQLAVQTAVISAAPGAGIDITRVLDSQATMAALAQVDPTDAAAVSAALATALTTHPHLAATLAGPPRGGSDFSTQPATVTPADFQRMGYGERAELKAANPDLYRQLAGT
ncbi:DUF7239 family protein [Yinghuangia soli]|uniref:Uncharacterized protein n=1 Tax=Yinghuangia soli TaxID=2908204 RepID=A0AA41Q7G3_9ACTN|nr:hypothetical protein [Yinghuangia soli]MCF2531744.1 hypothetical protein [Yinghuangia soli]